MYLEKPAWQQMNNNQEISVPYFCVLEFRVPVGIKLVASVLGEMKAGLAC
jgi:hypothetical protein